MLHENVTYDFFKALRIFVALKRAVLVDQNFFITVGWANMPRVKRDPRCETCGP